MASPVPPALSEGRLIGGRWRIARCIQAGGMGSVYEVVHRETQARCALKVMLPELVSSAEMRARFRQEAMVTATIESDHVVKVFDGGTDEETGAPYLVMELLRGEDLATRLADRGRLSAEEAVILLRQAALALERMHAAGVVHRDLKPANLFVTTRDDGSPCLKVLDFGIAKIVARTSLAETTRAVGTPLYMAPEQVRGDGRIKAPADLYALAQIAYRLLVGDAYWSEERAEDKNVYPLLMTIAEGPRERASERAARAGVTLPEAFDTWFARAVALAPEERFGGAREMIDALARALDVAVPPARALAEVDAGTRPIPRGGDAAGAPRERPAARSATMGAVTSDTIQPGRRSWVIPLAGAALALAGIGGLAWSSWRSPSPSPGAAGPPTTIGEPSGAPGGSPGPSASTKGTATVGASVREAASATPPEASATNVTTARPMAAARPGGRSMLPSLPSGRPVASASASAKAPPEPTDPSDVYRKGNGP